MEAFLNVRLHFLQGKVPGRILDLVPCPYLKSATHSQVDHESRVCLKNFSFKERGARGDMWDVTATPCLWKGTGSVTLSDGDAPLLGLTPTVTLERLGHLLPHRVSPWPRGLTSFTYAPRMLGRRPQVYVLIVSIVLVGASRPEPQPHLLWRVSHVLSGSAWSFLQGCRNLWCPY